MTTPVITDRVRGVDTGITAHPLDEAAPVSVQEQADPTDRVTPDSVLPAGRHGTAFTVVGLRNKTWIALAKCNTMDPALFFPHDSVGVRRAKRICAICPVKLACLAYALDNRLNHGVWGGTSERERRRILR